MKCVLKNASVYYKNKFRKLNVFIENGIINDITEDAPKADSGVVFDFQNKYIFPGFTDAHVHLREPGFSYKETVLTGSRACARGGYTTVFTMPNLSPVPDNAENLQKQLDIIKRDSVINVIPFGAITVGEKGETLSDMEAMADNVIGFSDDGKGVQNEPIMEEAMVKAKELEKIISAHCEENSLLNGGYIHKGEYALLNGHDGICSESEYLPVKRDIELAKKTGCKYHVCHISTKESVQLIREAKKAGVDITCETAPHYLVFCDMDLKDEGRFKMNPPIRSEEDRQALIEGIKDGTIDMIATDHAPHSAEEKAKGLKGSMMGVVGIETAFAAAYTHLVKKGVITLEKLIELLNKNAKMRFGVGASINKGEKANLCVFDLDYKYTVDPTEFLSMGKSTPFEGTEVFGRCLLTIADGKVVWQEKED